MEEASSDAGVAPAPVPGAACRINELPDDLLRRAISHMGALQLVQTSVLSRRWRGLWRSVPRINARHRAFFRMADTYKEHDALFKAFVSRFLMLRDPTALDVFNLRYFMPDGDLVDYDAKSEDANLWIGHALQCNARSIRVLVTEAKLQLASSLFATNCFLNSLELSNVALFPGFFKNLQKGCTLLERLSLYDCVIFDIEICSQTLKVFTIGSGCDFAFPERASISIPCLVHLGYFTLAPIPLLWPNMESLETASVSVYIHDTRAVSVYTHDTPADDICKVLRSLSGVANLNFHYKGETVRMEKGFQWCPKFNNLTILTLCEWCLCGYFYGLIVFLQNSPNLVKLTLELRKVKMEKGFQWCPKFNNLTILTLHEWCLCGDFYGLIAFLQNSPNLVKLTLELRKSQATDGTIIGDLEKDLSHVST